MKILSLQESLAKIDSVSIGGDEFDGIPEGTEPNEDARIAAKQILTILNKHSFLPHGVTTSPEGGITLVFLGIIPVSADIEIMNSGVISICKSKPPSVVVKEINKSELEKEMDAIAEDLKSFIYVS